MGRGSKFDLFYFSSNFNVVNCKNVHLDRPLKNSRFIFKKDQKVPNSWIEQF
jgi:hypothetical protein